MNGVVTMQMVGAEGVIATNKLGNSKRTTSEVAREITNPNAQRITEREISRPRERADGNRNSGGTRRW